jgi:hypothetical protein
MSFFLINTFKKCAAVKPKLTPIKTICPNELSACNVNCLPPSPEKINSKTNTANNAPMGSISIPSHFNIVDTFLFKGRFLRMGAITVGPVTTTNAPNKKDTCQLSSIT